MASFVVTGCAGFIGSHLVDALLARGDEVVGIDRFSGHYPRRMKEANLAGALADPGFRMIEGDLCAIDLDEAVDGAAGVFHLAAQPGVRGSWGEGFALYARDNLVATQRVAEAAAAAGARLVWASSSSVYGDAALHPTPEATPPRPISPYGVTKLACEALVGAGAARGLDAVTLRLFTVYGPRQRPDMGYNIFIRSILNQELITVDGDGTDSRSNTYVRDCVQGLILAFEQRAASAGEIFNIGGGEEVSVNEVLHMLQELSGQRARITHGPRRPGDQRRTVAAIGKARRLLGYAPATRLIDGLAAQIAWQREQMGFTQ